MGIDCTGMGGSGNVKRHSRASLVGTKDRNVRLPTVVKRNVVALAESEAQAAAGGTPQVAAAKLKCVEMAFDLADW